MAETALAPTFQNDTAENAYDVHVLVQRWDGDIIDQQMPYSPDQALHFKSHGLMSELDTDKLVADKVLPKADGTASYYSFDDYEKAVVQDYNEAQKGARSVYNDIMGEVDPGGSSMGKVEIDGVYDTNNIHWEFTDRALESAISSAERLNEMTGSDDMNPLIEQATLARQNLADAGANAKYAAETLFFGNVPKPPYVDLVDPVKKVDFSDYEIGAGDSTVVDPTVIKP